MADSDWQLLIHFQILFAVEPTSILKSSECPPRQHRKKCCAELTPFYFVMWLLKIKTSPDLFLSSWVYFKKCIHHQLKYKNKRSYMLRERFCAIMSCTHIFHWAGGEWLPQKTALVEIIIKMLVLTWRFKGKIEEWTGVERKCYSCLESYNTHK